MIKQSRSSSQLKKIFYAFEKTIFIGAIIHLLIIVIYAILTKEYIYLNMAHILDLQLVLPQLPYTKTVGALSSIPIIVLFFYFYLKKHEQKDDSKKTRTHLKNAFVARLQDLERDAVKKSE